MTHSTGHSHLRSVFIVAIGFAAIAFSATESRATVILPNVPAGTRYEILFVTLDTTTPISTDISTYNAFATSEANLSPTLASLGVQWHAVGTTASISALVNAPDNDIAVYNTQGILLASAATGIYNGSLLNPVQFNQFGTSESTEVWTGTQPDGGTAEGSQLGGASSGLGGGGVIIGQSFSATESWLDYESLGGNSILPVYALSSPINTPEPATIVLLVSALMVIGGMRLVRRRAQA
jgi:hypothetical protein